MRLFFSLILVAGSFYQSFAQTAVDQGKDNQFWNETQLVVWENEKNEVSLVGNLRVGRNFSFLSDYRAGISYSHKVSKYLSFSGTYVYRAAFPLKIEKLLKIVSAAR